MTAQQVVTQEKLAEAQAAADAAVVAADAAVEAAKLAAEKVAEVRSGDDVTAGQVADPEKSVKAQEADGGGMADGYRVIRHGPEDFSVEGVFHKDGSQKFSAANGFLSEVAARQWVSDQQAKGLSLDNRIGRKESGNRRERNERIWKMDDATSGASILTV